MYFMLYIEEINAKKTNPMVHNQAVSPNKTCIAPINIRKCRSTFDNERRLDLKLSFARALAQMTTKYVYKYTKQQTENFLASSGRVKYFHSMDVQA